MFRWLYSHLYQWKPWASAYQMIMTRSEYLATRASTNHVLVRVFTTAKHLREKVYTLSSDAWLDIYSCTGSGHTFSALCHHFLDSPLAQGHIQVVDIVAGHTFRGQGRKGCPVCTGIATANMKARNKTETIKWEAEMLIYIHDMDLGSAWYPYANIKLCRCPRWH